MDRGDSLPGLRPVRRAALLAVQGLVRPPEPPLCGLERAGRLNLLGVPGVVHDHGEGLEAQVDAARRSVWADSPGGVDVGAVDVELQRHPPAPGLLFHGCADDPGAAVGEPRGEPGQGLTGADPAGDAGQGDRMIGGRFGAVGVVAEPGAVLTFAERREADLSRHASLGMRLDRPDPANQGATCRCSARHSCSRSIAVHGTSVRSAGGTPQPFSAARRANAARILSRQKFSTNRDSPAWRPIAPACPGVGASSIVPDLLAARRRTPGRTPPSCRRPARLGR